MGATKRLAVLANPQSKNMSQKLGELFEKLNTIRLANLFENDADAEELGIAYGAYRMKPLLKLWEKYGDKYEEAVDVLKDKDETEDVSDDKKEQDKAQKTKAVLVYKKLTRVLKYDVLKQRVLDDCNHTCLCCDQEFPEKDEFKAERPDKAYPLYVRCHFPVVKYIEHAELFDVRELIKDEKIFNSKNYSAICLNCKPSRFIK